MQETIRYRLTARPCRAVRLIVASVALSSIGGVVSWAQHSMPPQPLKTPGPQSSQTSSNTSPPLQLDGAAVLNHLNQVISWYRHSTTGVQSVGLSSDAIYQDNAQSLEAEVVRLAFQSAKAEAEMIRVQQKISGATQPSGESTQQQKLAEMQAKTSSQIDQLQSQIENLDAQIAKTTPTRRGNLISQRDALQGQLELQKALLDAIQKMAAFVETNGEIAGGLEGSINQLARSIPEVLVASTNLQKTVSAPMPTKPTLANSGGLISQAMTLYDYMSAVHRIDGAINETNNARAVADQLRTPLRNALRATIQQSQNPANHRPPIRNSFKPSGKTSMISPSASNSSPVRFSHSARKSSCSMTARRILTNGASRSPANRSTFFAPYSSAWVELSWRWR